MNEAMQRVEIMDLVLGTSYSDSNYKERRRKNVAKCGSIDQYRMADKWIASMYKIFGGSCD